MSCRHVLTTPSVEFIYMTVGDTSVNMLFSQHFLWPFLIDI